MSKPRPLATPAASRLWFPPPHGGRVPDSPQEERGQGGCRPPASPAVVGAALCIFGNPWACLFAGKSEFLPLGVLEAGVDKGHNSEKGQEWADWGGAEARVGHEGGLGRGNSRTGWVRHGLDVGAPGQSHQLAGWTWTKVPSPNLVSTSKRLLPGSDRPGYES